MSSMMKNTSRIQVNEGKHVPLRSCVACREVKAKRELVRLVRTPEGNIELDKTGKKNGRGAYVCPTPGCWEKALTGKQLERTLRHPLSQANRAELKSSGKTLFKGAS